MVQGLEFAIHQSRYLSVQGLSCRCRHPVAPMVLGTFRLSVGQDAVSNHHLVSVVSCIHEDNYSP